MEIQSDGPVNVATLPTLEDQLNSIGVGRVQWIVVIASGIMVLGDGMEVAAVSLLERPLAREWGVSTDQLALIGSILFTGTIFGALLGGWCSDNYGRKWTLMSFGLLFIFGGISSVASQSFYVFAVARFVTGVGIGAAQGSAITLMAELSPTVHRGKLSMLVSGVGQAAGMGTVAILGIICRSSDIGQGWWRTMLLICIVPTILGIFILQNFVPESPHFCLVNGRHHDAEELILKIAKENGKEDMLIAGGRVCNVPAESSENKLSDLLDPELREPIAFICSVFIASCFAFHGHSFIYAIILQDVYHEDVPSEYYALAYAAAAQIVAVVVAAHLLDNPNFGRRRTKLLLYACSFSLSAMSPCITGLGYFKLANMALRAVMQASYSCAYVFGAELLPTAHRALGLAVCNSAGRGAAVASPVVMTALLRHSLGAVYAGFMTSAGLGLLATFVFQRETYGEYLAGFTHETWEGDNGAPLSTRRTLDSSPFHDHFKPSPRVAPKGGTPPPVFMRSASSTLPEDELAVISDRRSSST